MTRCCSRFAGASCRRSFRLAWLAAAVALAACGSDAEKWVKAGVTDEAAAADIGECEAYAESAGLAEPAPSNQFYTNVSPSGDLTTGPVPGAQSLGVVPRGDAFVRCMTSRGYRREATAD